MNDVTQDVPGLQKGENGMQSFSIPRLADGRPARLVTMFGRLGIKGQKRVRYIFDLGAPEYFEAEIAADGHIGSIVPQTPAAAWLGAGSRR